MTDVEKMLNAKQMHLTERKQKHPKNTEQWKECNAWAKGICDILIDLLNY